MRLKVKTVCLLVGWLIVAGASQAQKSSIDRHRDRLAHSITDSARAYWTLQLGEAYIHHRVDSALYYLHRSIHLARKQHDQLLLRRGYAKLARAYFEQSDFVKSLAIIQEGERLIGSGQVDSTQLEMQVMRSLDLRSLGDYPAALQLCLNLLNQYEPESYRWPRALGRLYTETGVIYDHLQQYDKALSFHQKRLAISMKLPNLHYRLVALGNLGTVLLNRRQLARAELFFSQTLILARRLGSYEDVAIAYISLGELAQRRHQYGKAIAYYQQGLLLARQHSGKEHIGLSLYFLATTYHQLHQYKQALSYVNQALSFFQAAQLDRYLLQALELKSQLLAQSGRYRQALTITQQARQLSDSLVGLDKQKTIAQIQGRFELAQKQQQIQTLHKNLTIQRQAHQTAQLQLALAQQQRWRSISVLGLTLLTLGIVYVAYRRQQAARQLLIRQKEEIARQAQQLSALNQTKDKLFSLIGHDLRSPVARLKQRLGQVRSMELTAEVQEPIRQLEVQTDQLLSLLTNLLEWSYVQVKGFKSNPQPLDLAELIDDVLMPLHEPICQKNLILLNQVTAPVWVMADNHRLEAVLRNLITNSIKFTPSGGYIRLWTKQTTDAFALVVQDTGIGMSAEQLTKLFEAPVVRTGTAGEPSTGLGLRLCRELLADPDAIRVVSDPQKGTLISIRLERCVQPVPSLIQT